MRRGLLFTMPIVLLIGCGGDDDGEGSTTTTEAESTLSAEAQRAVIACVEAQVDYAITMTVGSLDSARNSEANEKCLDAHTFIATEAPSGSKVPNEIAAALEGNAEDLAGWTLDISLGGEAELTAEGLDPAAAGTRWRDEIDRLLGELP